MTSEPQQTDANKVCGTNLDILTIEKELLTHFKVDMRALVDWVFHKNLESTKHSVQWKLMTAAHVYRPRMH
jgi:hypothetical protein